MEQSQPHHYTYPFELKGGLYPLTSIQLYSSHLAKIDAHLADKIQQAPNFFHHAPIVIDLQKINSADTTVDFIQLANILRKHHLVPIGVRGGTSTQHQAAALAELAILSEQKQPANTRPMPSQEEAQPQEITKHNDDVFVPQQSKLITTPVRSGQQIFAPYGDIIVTSHVSEGAELISAGHIHVYGALRGRALAGISGASHARIFCHCLEAELVSIAGNYQMSEELNKTTLWAQAVCVSLVDNNLHFNSI